LKAADSASQAKVSASDANSAAVESAQAVIITTNQADIATEKANIARNAASTAISHADEAELFAANASSSAIESEASAVKSKEYLDQIGTSVEDSNDAAIRAEVSRLAAEDSALRADNSDKSALEHRIAAETGALQVAKDKVTVLESITDAKGYSNDAKLASEEAADSAVKATTQATASAASAVTASTNADNAADNAGIAREQAVEATTQAGNASEAATEAEAAKSVVNTYKVAAETAKTVAQGYANDANQSANSAADSADTADKKAKEITAALTDATAKVDEATEAARVAGLHKTAASTSASLAETAKDYAATAATTSVNEAIRAESQADLAKGHADRAEEAAVAAEGSATSSEDSAASSKVYAEKSQEIYDAIQQGNVYKGTWDIKAENKYPTDKSTNAQWDVVIEGGGTHTFDGKSWKTGDEIIYVKAEDKFYQIAINVGVTSVDGKSGAVVLSGTYAPKSLETTKADQTYVVAELKKKADVTAVYSKAHVDNALKLKADTDAVNLQLNTKADKATTYTKTEVDDAIDGATGGSATKTYVDAQDATKLDKTALDILSKNGDKSLVITNSYGTGTFGCRNASYFHMDTTTPSFYMYKPLNASALTSRAQIAIGSATPSSDNHATRKDYVDNKVAATGWGGLSKRFSGDLNTIKTNQIIGVDVSASSNIPFKVQDGTLTCEMWESTSWGLQTYKDFYDGKVYQRTLLNGVWQKWAVNNPTQLQNPPTNDNQWNKLCSVVLPQSATELTITINGGTGFNVGQKPQLGQQRIHIRSGNNNPKGINIVSFSDGALNKMIVDMGWKLVSGDTYEIYARLANYADVVNWETSTSAAASVTWLDQGVGATEPTGLTKWLESVTTYNTRSKPTWADVGGTEYVKFADSHFQIGSSRWLRAGSAGTGFLPALGSTTGIDNSFLGTSSWMFGEAWVANYRGSGVNVTGTITAGNEVRGKLGRFTSSNASTQLVLKRDSLGSNVGIRFETSNADNFNHLNMRSNGQLCWGKDVDSEKNAVVYTSAFKPTAAELDAVAKSGDTMTGKLKLPTGALNGLSFGDAAYVGSNVSGRMAFYASTDREETKNGWVFRTLTGGQGKTDAAILDIAGNLTLKGIPKTSAVQSTASNSLTRKDYVDGQVTSSASGKVDVVESKLANGRKIVWHKTYRASNTVIAKLTRQDGELLNQAGAYKVTAFTDSTSTPTGAVAYFVNNAGSWTVKHMPYSVGSNHPEFLLKDGVPAVKTQHGNEYTISVIFEFITNPNNHTQGFAIGMPASIYATTAGGALTYNGNTFYHSGNKPTWADVGGDAKIKFVTGDHLQVGGNDWLRAADSTHGFLPSDSGSGSSSKSVLGTSSWWFKEAWSNIYRGGSINVNSDVLAGNNVKAQNFQTKDGKRLIDIASDKVLRIGNSTGAETHTRVHGTGVGSGYKVLAIWDGAKDNFVYNEGFKPTAADVGALTKEQGDGYYLAKTATATRATAADKLKINTSSSTTYYPLLSTSSTGASSSGICYIATGSNIPKVRYSDGHTQIAHGYLGTSGLVFNTSGHIAPRSASDCDAGMYGLYDSKKIGHIWSMGTGYKIATDGANFGKLYGLAYKHTNNTTGGTMAGSHQAVWCSSSGTPTVALGENLWAKNKIYEQGALLETRYMSKTQVIDGGTF